MILLLDTSTPICRLSLVENDTTYVSEWEAHRQLADGILKFIKDELEKREKTWNDLSGIAVMKGPGSFTGLRIGITVCNTLAQELAIPIVGESGEAWQQQSLNRLNIAENDIVVLPEYGSDAHITKPRK